MIELTGRFGLWPPLWRFGDAANFFDREEPLSTREWAASLLVFLPALACPSMKPDSNAICTSISSLTAMNLRTNMSLARRLCIALPLGVKLSARARLRCSVEDVEKLVDYACVFAALRAAAKTTSSDKSVDLNM